MKTIAIVMKELLKFLCNKIALRQGSLLRCSRKGCEVKGSRPST